MVKRLGRHLRDGHDFSYLNLGHSVSVRASPLDEIECVYFRGVHLFFSGHLKSVSKRLVRIGSEEMVQDSRAGVPVCG